MNMSPELISSLLSTSIPAATVITVAFFMMRYLSRGDSPLINRQFERTKAEIQEKLNALVIAAEEHRSGTSTPVIALTSDEREKTVNELLEKIRTEAQEKFLDDILLQVRNELAERTAFQLVKKQSEETIDRLKQELFSLSKRSNLSLSFGTAVTLLGLGLLGIFVTEVPSKSSDITAFFIEFIPRLSLVVLIEVFAYFFLNLYKTTLSEIKYFQNEITSMETKLLALAVATGSGNQEHITKVVDHLTLVERNFIIGKDQTTIDLERTRLDYDERLNMLGKLSEIVSKRSNS